MTGDGDSLQNRRFYQTQIFSDVFFVVGLLIAAILWFYLVHAVRIKELRYRLKAANDQNTSVRTMSLVSRYRLLRHSAGENDPGADYAREGRVMQILAETAYLNQSDDLNLAEHAAKLTIDFFDLIAGNPPYRHEKSSREHRLLERAFYHEITRSYKEAVAQYDTALEKISGDMRWYAHLHRGFCNAIGGSRPKAVADFREVIQSAGDEEYVETAKALLAMLSEIESKLKEVDAMPLSLQKAAAYYGLTAYDKAIITLNALPEAKNNAEGLYYLARSQEETGNAKQAADNYRRAIQMNSAAPWAVKANRRIFALGAFYAAGREYRTESKTNVEKGIIRDAQLLENARRFEKVSEQIDKGERQTVAALLEKPQPEEPGLRLSEITKQALSEASDRAQETVRIAKENAGPDWAALELLPRAEKISYINKQPRVEKIILEDGNQFRGILMSENRSRVFLFTALGKVVIYKSQIESREAGAP